MGEWREVESGEIGEWGGSFLSTYVLRYIDVSSTYSLVHGSNRDRETETTVNLMDKFASQLANLQRVASRAGGADGEDRIGDEHQNRDNRRDARGGRDGRRDRRHDGGGYDDRRHNDRRRDGYDNRRYDDGRDGYDRKRRRENDQYERNDRRPGRGGGRYNDRYARMEEPKEAHVPLADLVKGVAEKYKSTQQGSGLSDIGKRRHIALLFLTIDDLPHEHVWREWMKGASSDDDVMVSVLCHAKYPERITSPWLKQRHLIRFQRCSDEKQDACSQQQSPKLHSRRPEWGSIEITRGMIDLLEEGLRIGGEKGAVDATKSCNAFDKHTCYRRYVSTSCDALPETTDAAEEGPIQFDDDIPLVDRFIFASESCLPVATLKEVEMALFGPRTRILIQNPDDNNSVQKKNPYDKSWINARSTPNNGYSRQLQWDEIRPSDIPSNFIWKADQWLVLNRAHGEAVVSIPNNYLNGKSLWHAFRRCRASDEMYFPTALAILGIIVRPPGVVEVEQDERNEKCAGDQIRRRKLTYCDWSVSAKNPASFTAKDFEEVAAKARGEGCLFARKFVPLASNAKDAASGDGIVTDEDWLAVMQKLRTK